METYSVLCSDGKTRFYSRETPQEMWDEKKSMHARGYAYCKSVTSSGVRIFQWHKISECIETGTEFFGNESLPTYRWKDQDYIDQQIRAIRRPVAPILTYTAKSTGPKF